MPNGAFKGPTNLRDVTGFLASRGEGKAEAARAG